MNIYPFCPLRHIALHGFGFPKFRSFANLTSHTLRRSFGWKNGKLLEDSVFRTVRSHLVWTLDVDDSIPLIFCEASDLLKLPSLLTSNSPVTDSNSDAVLSSLKSLSEELQGKLSRSDGVADRLKQKLDTMQADMKSLESAVTSAITSLSSDLSSFSKEASKLDSISRSQHVASAAVRSPLGNSHASVSSSMDRSMNIVLFGVPEQSLFETRKSVEEVFSFLCGSPVPIRDLFRLGKFVEGRTRPRPVLVKLLNFWDKSLASKTKLKTFRISKVFIRPDLSPDERVNRRAKVAGNRDQDLSTATPVSNPLEISSDHVAGPGLGKSESKDVHLLD